MSTRDVSAGPEPADNLVHVNAWRFYAYFLRLGTFGFGGPIALAGFMQRDLVDQRKWLTRQDYLDGVFWTFAKAGAFVFGSGLAIVPFLYGELVQTNRWLTDREFLDAVAVAMITPGPVVITVAFVGYLVRGASGMLTAAAGVFLPVYLFVIVPAPYFRRHRAQPMMKSFVEGVSAAATGAIAGAGYVLGSRAIVDVWTAVIAAATFVILWRWKVSELWLIGAAALFGLLIRGVI